MFWDKAAGLYDLFEKVYNGDVNRRLVMHVADMIEANDEVLECACGTGMFTKEIAPRCRHLTATDYSNGMLKQARKKCAALENVDICSADITHLSFADEIFDKVVAGNVIHLLDHPEIAMQELMRTCKPDGKVIVPTYVNNENNGKPNLFVQALEKFGASFKKQFDYESYKRFFESMGYRDVDYTLIDGKMPCAIAVFTKR